MDIENYDLRIFQFNPAGRGTLEQEQFHSSLEAGGLKTLPLETLIHIFSFLDQSSLFRLEKVSSWCRGASREVWKEKSLDLSERALKNEELYQLIQGPFLSLKAILCKLNSEHARIFATSNLKVLVLDNNEVGDEGAEHLAKSTTLLKLSLGANHITSRGAKALFSNSHLKELSLSTNEIDDEGLTNFTALNTTLISLNLALNKITTKGAKNIVPHRSLLYLILYRNYIEDEAAEYIIETQSFNSLNLKGNPITPDKIKSFSKKFTIKHLIL
ncbi:MAG: F-box-like domain-containing protein [Alphaproteobacteria bacterium]|nr:F-box-like domain-containing protein [Alphaproteobacteria bacterium]